MDISAGFCTISSLHSCSELFPVTLRISQARCLYRLGDTEKMCNPRVWWQLLQSMLLTGADLSNDGSVGEFSRVSGGCQECLLGKQFWGQWCLVYIWADSKVGGRVSSESCWNPLHEIPTWHRGEKEKRYKKGSVNLHKRTTKCFCWSLVACLVHSEQPGGLQHKSCGWEAPANHMCTFSCRLHPGDRHHLFLWYMAQSFSQPHHCCQEVTSIKEISCELTQV